MSQAKPSLMPQALTLQNPQNKVNDQKQCFQKQILPQQLNQDANNGEKKQQDNDYECEFKLVVKQKFQEKLKNDSTNEFFTVIINEIIEQRIKRNFVADNEEALKPPQQPTVELDKDQQQIKKESTGPSELERLKAQDQQVKKKIKELMKRRPKKKALTTYELDPNRDKGFILAKRMNEIKQQREKKYILTKKENQEQKKSLLENQFATISCVQNYSMYLAQKSNNRRLRKESEDLQLPKIKLNNSFRNENESFRSSKNGFYDFLSQSRASTQKQISEDGRSDNLLAVRYDSLALSARSRYDSKSKDKKRDLLREIQVLRKSQKITEKYQTKKMVNDILTEIIFSSVKIVESKKQFFHNELPKPIHQMIRTYKDKNGKPLQQSGIKPEKFRINLHLKDTISKDKMNDYETKSNIDNSSRVRQITQCFEINLGNKSDKGQKQIEQNNSWNNQSNSKCNSDSDENDEQNSQHQKNERIVDASSECVDSQKQDNFEESSNSFQKFQ